MYYLSTLPLSWALKQIWAGSSGGRGRKGCDLSVQRRELNFCFPKDIIAGEEERVEDRSLRCSHRGKGGEEGSAESNTEWAIRKLKRVWKNQHADCAALPLKKTMMSA